ncbi:MAG TPA: hypothetical protein PKA77_09575 [Chitinophagaceae bacterium]|jgi:hypothetical protein|nr:hypothetical protein [Chitinophagaceae bacterium]HMU58968.1 hypothetical protein [Chitinophagaceae bacterium]
MYKIIISLLVAGFFSACNSTKLSDNSRNKRVDLQTDTINVVKLTDTLQIYQSVCRGCADEYIPRFDISDSLNIIEMLGTETVDNNPPDVDGGSLSKFIVMKPKKTGTTTIKFYRFMGDINAAKDSSDYTLYQITVTK